MRCAMLCECAHAKRAAANDPTGRKLAKLATDTPTIEVIRQGADRAKLQVTHKDRANHVSLSRQHDNLLVHRRIAKRDRTADPDSLALGGRDLVAHPFSDYLTLELRK